MPITKATASSIAPAAKGDLVVGSATNDASVLAVGSANQVLTVDSSTATGLKWAAPAATTPTGVGVAAVNIGTQSINNATDTVVNLNDEYWDTNGFHSTVTNNSRLTIPTGYGGYYLIFYKITFAGNTTGDRHAYFKKNGGGVETGKGACQFNADGVVTLSASIFDKYNAGDYIEMVVYQDSGGALNIGGSYPTNFSAIYLGA